MNSAGAALVLRLLLRKGWLSLEVCIVPLHLCGVLRSEIDGVATSLGFKKLHVDRVSVRGNTQQVLDPKATPFTRIWCCFEQATVAQGRKLKLDIATVQDGKCRLLTDGPANDYEECARSFFDLGSVPNECL